MMMDSAKPRTLLAALVTAVVTVASPLGAAPAHADEVANDITDAGAEEAVDPATEASEMAGTADAIEIDENLTLTTLDQKFCYMIANDVGRFLGEHPMGVEIDAAAFMRGFEDGVSGESAITQELKMRLGQQIQAAVEARREEQNAAMAKAAETFLAENAARDDVTVTASGLQYRVLESGEGASPTAADQVRVHYRGRLVDGTEFDSSYKRGEPATFGVVQVIPGWTEVLQLMKSGDKWEVVIPSELGYGERGAGGMIPPNATLIFDVELLEVIPANIEVTEEAMPE